jgi:hypothetical protein
MRRVIIVGGNKYPDCKIVETTEGNILGILVEKVSAYDILG